MVKCGEHFDATQFMNPVKKHLYLYAGADPAFGQGGGCKNNGTPTFAAAIANVSDHVHAPKTSYRNHHE